MEQDKVPKPEVKTIEELTEELQALAAKYNNDMTVLNRILSTYEDELSSLKGQFFDLSFKLKQLTQKPKPTGE